MINKNIIKINSYSSLHNLAKKAFCTFVVLALYFQQIAWPMDDMVIPTHRQEAVLLTEFSGLSKNSSDDEVTVPLLERHSPEQAIKVFSEVDAPKSYSTFSVEQKVPSREDISRQELLKIENSSWRNAVRWASIDTLFQRLGYALVLRTNELSSAEGKKKKCLPPVLLAGGSFPLMSEKLRKQALFIDGFREGTEFVIFRTIHTGVTVLAFYQLYNYLHQQTPLVCNLTTSSPQGIGDVVDFWQGSEDQVWLGLFHDILGGQNEVLSYLKYLMFAPVVWGGIKGLLNTRNSFLSNETIAELVEGIKAVKPSFKTDTLRWLLPCHPIDKKLNPLMDDALWNLDVSLDNLEKIEDCLETLVKVHKGYTAINALAYLMNIAHSLHIKDVNMFFVEGDDEEESLLERIKYRAKMKERALSLLHDVAKSMQGKTFGEKVRRGSTALYAKYLLWSLGVSRSLPEFMVPTLFKAGKLYAQAKFIQTIISAFLKAQKCPRQPGVSIAGVESWADDLTETCFKAFMGVFNVIPGQPTETLVGNLNQYYFPDCTIDLNLSRRGLSGIQVANITRALLEHNITFGSLDLSGNSLSSSGDFQAIFPYLNGVSSLSLADNGIGIPNSEDVVALANILAQLTSLTSLDLSINNMGYSDSLGIIALAQGLKSLPQLAFLSLSNNHIGYTDSLGTTALGNAFSALKQLTSLDLSSNMIGYTDSNGTVAIGQKLPNLLSLTSLNLSNNLIDYTDSLGSVALGNGLFYLTRLSELDLSINDIGVIDSDGIIALGEGLSPLTNLTYLDFSGTAIGSENNGTSTLGNSLSSLTELTYLGLSGADITHESFQPILKSLSKLNRLKIFKLLPSQVTNSDILEANQALNRSFAPPLPSIIASEEDVKSFCDSLPLSLQECDLSWRIPSVTAPIVTSLLQCLQFQGNLISLNLSNNNIGIPNSEGCVTLGSGLSSLTQLKFLDLSSNSIDFTNSLCSTALGQGVFGLTQLISLNLANNVIGYTDSKGTVALSRGISNLKQLSSLDISDNHLGYTGSDGTVELGKALSNLKKLTFLNLKKNVIGYTDSLGSVSIAQGLSGLSELESINLSINWIDFWNSDTSVALGQTLSNLNKLSFLELSGNGIGLTDSVGAVTFGEGLGNLENLIFLGLSYNYIGYTNSLGTLALAGGLNQTRKLQLINLSYNKIGLTGSQGSEILVPVLLSLPNLKVENLSVQGMTNISWTSISQYMQNRQSVAMMEACQSNKCFGTRIPLSSNGPQEVSLSSASDQNYYFIGNTTYIGEKFPSLLNEGESRSLVVYDEEVATFIEPDIFSTLGFSAVSGAVFAALPEALGDALHLSGMVSERNAYHVKMATNAAFVFATGSWLPTGASWLTSTGLKYMGCSESKARVGGNAVGFLVNMGKIITPTGIAAVAVNYAAGRLGLWAEKNMIQRFFSGAQTKGPSPTL